MLRVLVRGRRENVEKAGFLGGNWGEEIYFWVGDGCAIGAQMRNVAGLAAGLQMLDLHDLLQLHGLMDLGRENAQEVFHGRILCVFRMRNA
jgi:hypothetical protein